MGCLAWNKDNGIICAGLNNGSLKILKFEESNGFQGQNSWEKSETEGKCQYMVSHCVVGLARVDFWILLQVSRVISLCGSVHILKPVSEEIFWKHNIFNF